MEHRMTIEPHRQLLFRALEHPHRALYWTAPASEGSELTTEDPLALDYVAQQLGLVLLPTLTTRSSRAQAFAMVLYGLALVERAIVHYGYPATDEMRRELFERWERFWALASFESRGGQIPRGDWDTMRGVRGARAAWKPGGDKLPLDFPLISRQQELGNLGAFLAPLRRAGLVLEGTLRPGPAALEIIESFWDEPDQNRHRARYDEYALLALDRTRTKIDRSNGSLTLARVGERSRLTVLNTAQRTAQQRRLFDALFEHAPDPFTRAVVALVEAAARAGVVESRDVLRGAFKGQYGPLDPGLRDLVDTAIRLGDAVQTLIAAFDRVYLAVDQGGWVVPRAKVVTDAFSPEQLTALHHACTRLLAAPAVREIRRMPMHGAALLRLAEELSEADAPTALDQLLAYHALVQRDRRRGAGWIRDEGDRLVLVVTSYTARPTAVRFPSFKLDVVRTLLSDLGRLPLVGVEGGEEVSS
jgi:hypothetical protein